MVTTLSILGCSLSKPLLENSQLFIYMGANIRAAGASWKTQMWEFRAGIQSPDRLPAQPNPGPCTTCPHRKKDGEDSRWAVGRGRWWMRQCRDRIATREKRKASQCFAATEKPEGPEPGPDSQLKQCWECSNDQARSGRILPQVFASV
jgi:hypothetical protein